MWRRWFQSWLPSFSGGGVRPGWIDEETALDTANEWFCASAVKGYGIRTEDQ
ncbi:hypothetical protein [Paenibacillus sp. MDMC362]|uniref:hypothetical protein n=1 Tax=Paenibacillus sp. MDMC362 TaxID=2977365 RepID=UPI0021A76EC7|nr:hypothetical protein [Paenibacillus sp. MDMC362]